MPTSWPIDEEYLGYRIRVRGGRPGDFPGLFAAAEIRGQDDAVICHFAELLDSALQGIRSYGWPQNDEEATRMLMERAFHRARGAILLDRLPDVDGQRFPVPPEPQFAERSAEYLRSLVLNAFKRVFKHDPREGIDIDFDHIGVALREGIETKDVEYILGRLKGDGLIEAGAAGRQHGCAWYMPTPAGLTEADRLAIPARAPGLLLEETVAEVERRLNRHSPELVRRFRELFVKVVEPGQLTHVDVGEIAQTCDLLIQEFLDLPVVWEGVSGERPPRDQTKDRLSAILSARVSSETEEGLIRGLGDYLLGWFGPLDKFVNKYRHPLDPELSQRLHAKRLVIYTYLLVGDLIELLDI